MSGDLITKVADEMRTLFEQRLRIKGRSLEQQVHKAGRALPRKVRSDARSVVDALAVQGNPKLARMVDEKRIAQSGRNVVAYLKTIDPQDRLKGQVLSWLGAVSAFGIILFVVLVWVAVKRGLV
ncbi:hypothetical protein SAMN04488515_0423 [Cognatiyoonia koreensis]|uniref:Uncharacterized protein n=1 Tax=Cognatiyoonia koreensis TaxID=364200 RepID=A0A1I0N665_9RHOB|nr:hypothetical protein [Cognatiyoonia koreensis]SEV96281.1 hypothetical protein SAMN04488515_0423 [Cognatiyoonia koreensis]